MDLSKKQIGQISYPLHQDDRGRFSYPELLELIFGPQEWQELQKRHNLSGKNLKSSIDGSKGNKIQFSDNFKMMIEYFHGELLTA